MQPQAGMRVLPLKVLDNLDSFQLSASPSLGLVLILRVHSDHQNAGQ